MTRYELLAVIIIANVVAWIFYLVFARVTVRKLERNDALRQQLGFEPISGWRIFNVAEALVLPMSFFNRVRSGQLSWLFADAALLRANTGGLDKLLAHLFFWTFLGSGLALLVLIGLDAAGLVA